MRFVRLRKWQMYRNLLNKSHLYQHERIFPPFFRTKWPNQKVHICTRTLLLIILQLSFMGGPSCSFWNRHYSFFSNFVHNFAFKCVPEYYGLDFLGFFSLLLLSFDDIFMTSWEREPKKKRTRKSGPLIGHRGVNSFLKLGGQPP